MLVFCLLLLSLCMFFNVWTLFCDAVIYVFLDVPKCVLVHIRIKGEIGAV